jgi:hypothetical protein
VFSTRSVDVSLARRFNAGIMGISRSCRVATIEIALVAELCLTLTKCLTEK